MLPSIHLVRIEKGKSRILKIADFKDSEVNARARGFEVMIEKFIKKVRLLLTTSFSTLNIFL